jgi:hypothetical protein
MTSACIRQEKSNQPDKLKFDGYAIQISDNREE